MNPFRFSSLLFIVMLLVLVGCQTSLTPTPLAPTATALAPTASPPTEVLTPTARVSTPTPELSTPTAQVPTPSPTPTPLVLNELVQQFNYNSTIPLNIRELEPPDLKRLQITLPEGATLREIAYDAPGGVVKAYLVEPRGKGPFAGVLWVHKYPGTNTEFLPEAMSLANQGVVSLLIEGRYPWQSVSGKFEVDRLSIINQVLDLRRGLDLLLARDDIDRSRIAYVGHDYGAMHGAVLAGVDKRVKAYVLMTPTGSYYDWRNYFGPLERSELQEYIRLAPTLAPLTYVSHANPAQLLFQFAQKDRFVSAERADALFAAASEPKQKKMYDAPHELDEAARSDRTGFLVAVLSLK
ncbi:MAG: hypothetical protein HY741_07215 [Chloroflexi bacterium]|nr:hypothetical protein [Chloroflexota bacterium]